MGAFEILWHVGVEIVEVDGEIIADFILAELKMSGREIHLSFIFSAQKKYENDL